MNLALETAGSSDRVDHRSNQERGINRIPQSKSIIGRRMRQRGRASVQAWKEAHVIESNHALRQIEAERIALTHALDDHYFRCRGDDVHEGHASVQNTAVVIGDQHKKAARERYQDVLLAERYGSRDHLSLNVRMSIVYVDRNSESDITELTFNDRGQLADSGSIHHYVAGSDEALRCGAQLARAAGWQHVALSGDTSFIYRAAVVYGFAGLRVEAADPTDRAVVAHALAHVEREQMNYKPPECGTQQTRNDDRENGEVMQ